MLMERIYLSSRVFFPADNNSQGPVVFTQDIKLSNQTKEGVFGPSGSVQYKPYFPRCLKLSAEVTSLIKIWKRGSATQFTVALYEILIVKGFFFLN